MTRNLLQITTSVVRRLPLSNDLPFVVGNSDPIAKQLLELLQEEGDELVERHEWSNLINDFNFTITVDPNTAPLPADFNRLESQTSVWRSDSLLTPLSGPTSADSWHRLLDIPGTFPGYWRLIDGAMETIGVAPGLSCTIPYISQSWILDVNSASTKPLWSADTDTPRLNDNLFILGARWRWKQSKGLDYGEDMATYERWLERAIAADRAARPIGTSRQRMEMDLSQYTWPGTIIPPAA
jgi:hypothetical protein